MSAESERSWRRELLAVLPAPPFPGGHWPGNPGERLLIQLARQWRVLWAHAPLDGERLAIGRAGLDPVLVDTVSCITATISRQLVSAVVLVGTDTVRSCIERLHAFASHLPILALLDAPVSSRLGDAWSWEQAEFDLSLADHILAASGEVLEDASAYLRRSKIPAELLPNGLGDAAWADLSRRLSRQIPGLFERSNAGADPRSVQALIFLRPEDERQAPARLDEWRGTLAEAGRRVVVAPDAPWSRRLVAAWDRADRIFYRRAPDAVDAVNRVLLRHPETLMATSRARLNPVASRLALACARRSPLAAAVGYDTAENAPQEWNAWLAFGHAWSLRYRGSYRAAARLEDDCLLVHRRAIEAVGGLDPRLSWAHAVRDLCLRSRQAGLRLLIAEDWVGSSHAAEADPDAASADLFIRKWKLDPLALASGDAARAALTGGRGATTISRLRSKNGGTD